MAIKIMHFAQKAALWAICRHFFRTERNSKLKLQKIKKNKVENADPEPNCHS
jgi:hypothetical protein